MNFFKNAVYVLVFINLVSLGFNGWMYKELHEPDIIMASDPALSTLIEECRARDTHIKGHTSNPPSPWNTPARKAGYVSSL